MHSRSTLLSIFSSLNTSPSSDVCIFSTTFSGSEDSFTRFLDLMWKSDLFYFLTPSCLPMEPLGGFEGKHEKVAKAEISSVSHYWSTKKVGTTTWPLMPCPLNIWPRTARFRVRLFRMKEKCFVMPLLGLYVWFGRSGDLKQSLSGGDSGHCPVK